MSVRILVISPYPVVPQLHGGRTRIIGLATGMARAGAQVTILCPWHPRQPRRALLEQRLALRTHRLAANALPALLPSTVASPLALLSLQPRGSWGARRLLRSFESFDVVQLEFCAQARWLEGLGAVRTVYSAHNVERDFFRAHAARYHLRRWSLRRLERLEQLAVGQSDLVVTCSEHDADRLTTVYGRARRTVVVPNGLDGSLLELDRAALRNEARAALGFGPRERVLLFLGGNAWHNREGLDFLARELLPNLGGDARLLVVGTSGRYLRGSDGDRIRAVGFVENLRPYLAAADVGLNPIADASGSSVKLADYVAAGLPAITTPAGARGFENLSGVRIVPREAFAEAVRNPPSEPPAERSTLGALTWDGRARRLLSEYERLV